MIVSDNGTSNAVLRWAAEQGIEWHYIGKRCFAATFVAMA